MEQHQEQKTVIKLRSTAPQRHSIIEAIYMHFQAWNTCLERPPLIPDWTQKHHDLVDQICDDILPRGSGIDCGTKFDWVNSKLKPEKLIFNLSFHHMNDVGMYDGWTEHNLIVTPSFFGGFDMRFTGPNRNDIKEYLYDVYSHVFTKTVILEQTAGRESARYVEVE